MMCERFTRDKKGRRFGEYKGSCVRGVKRGRRSVNEGKRREEEAQEARAVGCSWGQRDLPNNKRTMKKAALPVKDSVYTKLLIDWMFICTKLCHMKL
jgi:hypothetical protein